MEPVEQQAGERELRSALEQNEFRLSYQPQLDALTGRIVGAEALLRWQDPAMGSLRGPDQFLQSLESTGLIVPVGEWAFRRATEDCRRWQRLGLPRLKLGLNVSPVQLAPIYRQPLLARIEELRDWCEVQIEISGAHLVNPPEWLLKSLQALRFAGADIAVQDFGMDDTVHRRLWALPVDTLKIHRSFIARMADESVDEELAGMLVLARAFRLGSVAEGVESDAQLIRLRELHCERSQGFLHSVPVQPERFEWMLRASQCSRGEGDAHASLLALDA